MEGSVITKLNDLKSISWWNRLLRWNIVKNTIDDIKDHYNEERSTLQNSSRGALDRTAFLEKQLFEEQTKATSAHERIVLLEKIITDLQTKDTERTERYAVNLEEISRVKNILEQERQVLAEKKEREYTERLEAMKETWRRHEKRVEEEVRIICKKHNIEYLGQTDVPFKGKPDNTIVIGGLFTIFDAKSPAGDDLENFPRYIKTQAESAKKYTNEQDVRNDLFLVVPENTLQALTDFSYDIGTYRVNVIPVQALEPIIVGLKKIEEFEFNEDLDPEVRENLIKVVGKLIHDVKRGIQITNNVSSYLIGSLNNLRTLPAELVNQIEEQEKAEKFNPPQEQRRKIIKQDDLEKELELIIKNV